MEQNLLCGIIYCFPLLLNSYLILILLFLMKLIKIIRCDDECYNDVSSIVLLFTAFNVESWRPIYHDQHLATWIFLVCNVYLHFV